MKLLIGLALAALACGQSKQTNPPAPAPAEQAVPAPGVSGTLLVGNKNEDTVSFIDLATGRELGRAATGRMPHEIAVSPDGIRAAVVAYGGHSVDIFRVEDRRRLLHHRSFAQ